MDNFKHRLIEFRSLYLLLFKVYIVLTIFAISSMALFGYDISWGLSVLFILCILTFSGGYMFALVLKFRFKSNIEWLGFSYLIGLFLNILLYFPIVLTHVEKIMPLILICFVIFLLELTICLFTSGEMAVVQISNL